MILNGVFLVTGEHDTGKTTFALECGASPDRIAFFDDDIKGRATVKEFRDRGEDFGAYFDLVKLGHKAKLIEFHAGCLKLVDAIQPGQFDAIVWDTWSRFALTCGIYVKAFPNEFRDPSRWAHSGRIKGAEMNKEGTLYEAAVINRLAQLAPTVILVTHLKDQYLNNTKTGKLIPAHGKTLARVPRFRLWLRQNPDGRPVPIGLFLKRFDRKRMTGRGIRTTCIVPRKIVPVQEDESLWDTIWQYWDNPVGNRAPTPEETPNQFELSILDGTLTDDQRRTYNLILRSGVLIEDEEPMKPEPKPEPPKPDPILVLAQAGKSATEIAKELGKPLPVVRRLIGKGLK